MNKTVKKLLKTIDELCNTKYVADVEDALAILAAAAGGEEYIADILDEEDDDCDCPRCCDDDDDEIADELASWDLETDSQGRVHLTKEMVDGIRHNQKKAVGPGLAVGRVDYDLEVDLACGKDALPRCKEDYSSVSFIEKQINGGYWVNVNSIFGPNTKCTLRLFEDGTAVITEAGWSW